MGMQGRAEMTQLVIVLSIFLWLAPQLTASAAPVAPSKQRFYVYDWPEVVNKYAKYGGHEYNRFFQMNSGAGMEIDASRGHFHTWQFALFKIIYERALVDPRRTMDPAEATTFLLPYDFGLDACFRQDNGKMRKANCPLAEKVVQRLQASPYYQKSKGADHLLIVSVNQNIDYFLGAEHCQKFLSDHCKHCLKVSIDDYSFLHIHRKSFISKKGENWYAVPFPADIHYTSGMTAPPPWAMHPSYENQQASGSQGRVKPQRHMIVSYTGSRRSMNAASYNIRKSLAENCDEYGPDR